MELDNTGEMIISNFLIGQSTSLGSVKPRKSITLLIMYNTVVLYWVT